MVRKDRQNVAHVLSIILAGGAGKRLFPLTQDRSKPAVPLGGKYRLIDIPISNCLNSGLKKIFVLTQFNSASLNHHVVNSYRFDPFAEGFIEVLAAEQTVSNPNWFQGTADAVRQHLHRFTGRDDDFQLILAGDQLYRMNYHAMLESHWRRGAVTPGRIDADRQVRAARQSVLRQVGVDDTGLDDKFFVPLASADGTNRSAKRVERQRRH